MKRDLKKLADAEYDLLIIGGGIYGVAVAWDATLRGLKVALIDKGDFASATSSNSLKIIHGGLRYLQHLDIRRMRESIHERRVLMKIAPHLIHPLAFVMPVCGSSLKNLPSMFTALLLNDVIGFDRNRLPDPQKHIPKGRLISKKEIENYIPGYSDKGVVGGILWYDCQCHNTERLVISYGLSAALQGAELANYVECVGFMMKGDRVCGIRAKDILTGERFDIRSRLIINAGGPWIDDVLQRIDERQFKKRFNHSFAMNIIVSKRMLDRYAAGLPVRYRYRSEDGSVYDGKKVLFFVPWRDYTMIGTYHAPYNGSPDIKEDKEAELHEFLKSVKETCIGVHLDSDDISLVHSGLIPMAGINPKTGEVKLLRRFKIFDHEVEDGLKGLISIMGVKFTTHRHVVSKTVDIALKKLGRKDGRSLTEEIPVYGGGIDRFEEFFNRAVRESKLSEGITRHLVYNYGSEFRSILRYGDEDKGLLGLIDGSREVIKAEVVNAVRNEMALKLSDVVLRRTDLGSAGNPGERALRSTADIMARELGWDKERIEEEVKETMAIYPAI